jgi:hypothetical protein
MSKEEILNTGLSLAMEFGENWLKPIQSRLAALEPNLRPAELEEYNSICQAAMKSSNGWIYSTAEKSGQEPDRKVWEAEVLSSHPWINKDNLDRLFSQGVYYAGKDGLFG